MDYHLLKKNITSIKYTDGKDLKNLIQNKNNKLIDENKIIAMFD
jgi:hypothetical protein